MTTPSKKEASVIGGGPCGSLLAMFLVEAGYEVDVYELRPEEEAEEAGGVLGKAASATKRSINFALSHRGICALRELGLDQEILAESVEMHSRYVHLADGSVAEQRYGGPGEAIYSVSRPDVVGLLEKAARRRGAVYHHGHKLVGFEEASTKPQFEVAGGVITAKGGGPTFGCDGAFSATRRLLERRGRYDTKVWFATQGYKELHIPPNAQGGYVFPPNYLHIWPRGDNMLIALPNKGGSFTATVFANCGELEEMERSWSREQVEEWFTSNFGDVRPHMPSLLEDWFANPAAPLLQLQVAPWHFKKDRVLLMGDASHAVVPFYGQGMNAAFEDCLFFAETLKAKQGNLEATFAEMSGPRRKAADALSTLATMNYDDMASKSASRLYRLQSILENAIHRLLPRVWIPLYTMVTFTRMPYDTVLAEHFRQKRVVEALTKVTLVAATAVATIGVRAAAAAMRKRS